VSSSSVTLETPSFAQRMWQKLEDARIKRHLRAARNEVAKSRHPDFTTEQVQRRNGALLALDGFIATGVFPRNADFASPTPYLRDQYGSVCAVASMMVASGDMAIVEHLQRVDNNMWLGDIQDGELERWLIRNGFTQAEAARIQVPYNGPPREPSFVQQHEVAIVIAVAVGTFFLLQFLYYTLIPAKSVGRMHAIACSTVALAASIGMIVFVNGLIPPTPW
jgi:hypothetical protein